MKAMLTILFTILTLNLKAPEYKTIPIPEGEVIKPFDPVLYSFCKVESNFDTDTINKLGYTGLLQIGQEMTDEANRINEMSGNPLRFTFPGCALDSLQSVQIWYTVQSYWNKSYNVKRAAYIWNPKSSINYYLKIKKEILSL